MEQAGHRLFVLVIMGSERRLIDLAEVREIVPAMRLATPRGVSGACRGLANLRGAIVPVFDPTGESPALHDGQLIVVMSQAEGLIGILVDDVVDVITIEAGRVVKHPVGGGAVMRTVNLHGATVSVFSLEEALHAA